MSDEDKALKMIAESQAEIKISVIELSKASVDLSNNFSEFLIKDSARHEREKIQQKDIDELKLFRSENEYVIKRVTHSFTLIDSAWSKILTSIIIIVLLSAGVVTLPKLIETHQESEAKK